MTVIHLKKRDVVKSKVRGVDLEFDHEKLATILGVPGKNGICEYIKEVWEESKYTKPLEITRRFANDDTIMKARRVKSVEMKPSQRFIHFLVMKNVIPRFGKRDTTSFMDLSYMDHLTARRLVNLPRVMMRHMSYVISVKDHELPYGDWLTMVFDAFGVPLVDKKGEEPKRYDYFEEIFLTMWESGSDDQFYDARVEVEEPVMKLSDSSDPSFISGSAEGQGALQSRPLVPHCGLRKAEFTKFQASLKEREQTDFMMIWRRRRRECRTSALLHQAQTKPHP
ncbi:hypothetical protein Dimus_031888 [Dionaea muscipula]